LDVQGMSSGFTVVEDGDDSGGIGFGDDMG
jgi:hypothetical protein